MRVHSYQIFWKKIIAEPHDGCLFGQAKCFVSTKKTPIYALEGNFPLLLSQRKIAAADLSAITGSRRLVAL